MRGSTDPIEPPSFSIVVPTYQRRDVVSDAVHALSRIDYRGTFEVIVVVDGSTDGTAAALRRAQCPVPLRVIEQENRGLANARNRGAAEATGDILLFLDDDMICEPDVLKQHASSYAAGADAVIGDFPVAPGSRAGFLSDAIADRKTWERDGEALTAFDIFAGHISVRRSAFEEIGGFDENFTRNGAYGNEDIDFGQRLLQRHRVRRNGNAVSYQRSLVGPREYIRRARSIAEADLHFAAKHPQLGRELFDRRGASRISRRLRLLSGVPLLPALFGEAAGCLAEIGLRTPIRSSKPLSRLFHSAYALTYWSTVRRNGGVPAP